ncbi:hypothetical protein [Glycomyces dulcitolivorans]|uniref:hypothetical protein n=1 Tax=Glycomyces dulcitolivorans TaxID=2200759 RepID=UPI000DD48805|nr:hypothetical protein [Glycomyces dulcitolivorans]
MPESIRSLLHDIADDGSQPSRDLAAGAYKRARTITRRRFAIGAVSVVTALALGGAGTAGLLDRDDEALPSPADPTTTAEGVETTEEETDEGSGCGVRPQDWDDQGFTFPALDDSGTERDMEGELPNPMNYRLVNQEDGESTWRLYEDDRTEALDIEGDYVYNVAPDGNRVAAINRGDLCSGAYMEIGFDSSQEAIPVLTVEPVHCPTVWSQDSDKLLFTEPTVYEDAKTYVLNVSTGELTVLAEMQGDMFCAGEWMPDSERIWSGSDLIWNLDGTVDRELPALADLVANQNLLGAGISADGGEACFDDLGEAEGDSSGRFCDVYVDTATGEELDLPVEGENRQVVFLYDGTMLILSHADGVATQFLVDADGNVVDERELPAELGGDSLELVTYYNW